LPGSFSKSFRAVSDRQDFIAVMLYREANPSEIGIQRTKQVAYTTTALDAPVEQFDMTDFCASPDHAVIYAKYELAKRKFSTHTISFQTALITTASSRLTSSKSSGSASHRAATTAPKSSGIKSLASPTAPMAAVRLRQSISR
jgi:hypothetical protein